MYRIIRDLNHGREVKKEEKKQIVPSHSNAILLLM